MKKRVVITGMDVSTPIGTGVDKFWAAALAGKSGIARIKKYDPSPYPTQIAGEIDDIDLSRYPDLNKPRRYPRAVQFALYCALEALKDAGLEPRAKELANAGTYIGTGQGGGPESEDVYRLFYEQKWKKIPAMSILKTMPNAIANHVAITCGCGGPNVSVTNACASSAQAIGMAFEQIQAGQISLAMTGGTESMIWETAMAAWCKMRVMSTQNEFPSQASCPFDKNRDGMVMSEGAGLLILEELEQAKARGAKIYSEIIAFASGCDTHHITAPCPKGQARTARAALDNGQLTAADIQYISAHGTSTVLNDRSETEMIKDVFGERAYDIPISSLKSMLGHSIGAAGVLEIAATALSLRDGMLHPTINLETADEDCDLDYVPNEKRKAPIDIALSNHFAFGGANSVLILKRY